DGLRELGFEEGKQLILDVRDAKGDLKSVEAAAAALEAEKVDLIYAVATSVTLAARRATKTVPIVFYAGTDPVALGLVDSFRKRRETHRDSRSGDGPDAEGPCTSQGHASGAPPGGHLLQP